MTKSAKRIAVIALLLVLAALVVYCAVSGKPAGENGAQTEEISSMEDAQKQAEILSASAATAYENQSAIQITLADGTSTAAAASVQVEGNLITITAPGIYQLSGTLTDGQILVNTEGTVTLILDGVDITNSAGAAIQIANAEHALVYLPESTENSLISGTEQEITAASENNTLTSASGAALYARDDLSFAGAGSLTVGGYLNNGIATTNRLTVLGGTLNIEAVNNGLKGKDSVLILGGVCSITAGNDGIKSNNDTDTLCGIVEIRGGTVNLSTLGDGIQAAQSLSVEDGTVGITAGSLSESAAAQTMQPEDNMMGNSGDLPENMQDMAGDDMTAPSGDMTPPDGDMAAPNGDMTAQGENLTPPDGELPDGETMPELPEGSGAADGMTPPENGDQAGEAPELPQGTDTDFDGEAGSPMDTEGGRQQGMGGGLPESFSWDTSSTSGASTKGLKSGGNLTIGGGSITITSADDCLHADGNVSITGGSLYLASGDDGIHAGNTLTFAGAELTITQSYEGLEANFIYIQSGNISVTASDDGLNANGGSSSFGMMFSSDNSDDSALSVLQITGGTLYVNAGGDGLDSNGDLIVDGGAIIVDGPSDSGNAALDSGSESGGVLLCNGGTVLAIGGSGMAESFESDSAQPSFLYNFNGSLSAGTEITISDADGNVIFTHTAAKAFNSVVFSSAELTEGTTVTLTAGDESVEIAIDGISNGNSTGTGTGMGGNMGGSPGGMGGGLRKR